MGPTLEPGFEERVSTSLVIVRTCNPKLPFVLLHVHLPVNSKKSTAVRVSRATCSLLLRKGCQCGRQKDLSPANNKHHGVMRPETKTSEHYSLCAAPILGLCAVTKCAFMFATTSSHTQSHRHFISRSQRRCQTVKNRVAETPMKHQSNQIKSGTKYYAHTHLQAESTRAKDHYRAMLREVPNLSLIV
jgi:hypothetical protein